MDGSALQQYQPTPKGGKLRFIVKQTENEEESLIDVAILRSCLLAKLRKLLAEIRYNTALGHMFLFYNYMPEEYDEANRQAEMKWKQLVIQGLRENNETEEKNFGREYIVANVCLSDKELQYVQKLR